jgi:hypothetical protein
MNPDSQLCFREPVLYEKLSCAVFMSAAGLRIRIPLNADPDRSNFSLYRTTLPERDPAFHLNADPDLFLIIVMRISDNWSIGPPGLHFEPLGLHCKRPRLYFEPLKPDLDSASKSIADLDQQKCQNWKIGINYFVPPLIVLESPQENNAILKF